MGSTPASNHIYLNGELAVQLHLLEDNIDHGNEWSTHSVEQKADQQIRVCWQLHKKSNNRIGSVRPPDRPTVRLFVCLSVLSRLNLL